MIMIVPSSLRVTIQYIHFLPSDNSWMYNCAFSHPQKQEHKAFLIFIALVVYTFLVDAVMGAPTTEQISTTQPPSHH